MLNTAQSERRAVVHLLPVKHVSPFNKLQSHGHKGILIRKWAEPVTLARNNAIIKKE